MSNSIRRFLAILAAVSVFGLVGNASAQDEKKEEEKTEEKVEEKAEASGLDSKAEDYVNMAVNMMCYDKRLDAGAANKAKEYYLELEGMTLAEYQALQKEYQGNTAVKDAITAEVDLCGSRVLALPPEDEPKEEEVEEEPPKDIKDPTFAIWANKMQWRGKHGKYKLMLAYKKGRVKGNITWKGGAMGFSGAIKNKYKKKPKVDVKGSSGKMNDIRGTCTFKLTKHEDWRKKREEANKWKDKYEKLVDKDGTLWEWSKAECAMTFKIQGKKGSGKFNPTSDTY